MLSKILSTATLIVLGWLSIQMLHTQKALDSSQVTFRNALAELRSEINGSSEQNESLSADVLERMDLLSAEQEKLALTTAEAAAANKLGPKLLKEKTDIINSMNDKAALRDAYTTVLKATLHGHAKEGAKASELLLSTKSIIWKSSGKLAKSKDALRGLMQPIDVLSGKWKRGDFSGTSTSIQDVLLAALNGQAKS